jgi:hypothetical protein
MPAIGAQLSLRRVAAKVCSPTPERPLAFTSDVADLDLRMGESPAGKLDGERIVSATRRFESGSLSQPIRPFDASASDLASPITPVRRKITAIRLREARTGRRTRAPAGG